MPYNQSIGPRHPVMFKQKLPVPGPQLFLLLPLLCYVIVNGINPFVPLIILNKAKTVPDPYIAALLTALLQAVHNLSAAKAAGGILLHQSCHIWLVLGMHPIHGIIPVQVPRFLIFHTRHCRKTIG